MKKIYFIALIFLSLNSLVAQSPTFRLEDKMNSNAVVVNNQIFYHSTTSFATVSHDMELVNLTSSNLVMSVRKYDDVINTVSASDMAAAYFCTGTTCYNANVMNVTFTLAPNEVLDFKAYIDEASLAGPSSIRYKFANGAEELWVEFKYNMPTGINESNVNSVNVSELYPNPAQNWTNLNVFSDSETTVNLSISNMLGGVVYTEVSEIAPGENNIKISTRDLANGIYYVSVNTGNSTITKKISITK